jgi:hypothetical protein
MARQREGAPRPVEVISRERGGYRANFIATDVVTVKV